ncbi:uncharacterized protein TNIN_418271 [Trichonephila inaurata madagascariensis]|uniref:Albumin 1 n=1 Tax=Trichonephila inaurata madagascariensis TaxID=2747483 RepID=A0A8X6XWH5_9ARAC|nr:uncharacterized protein TNIN_418271 [Trichonephila inaurata madagascariensis]
MRSLLFSGLFLILATYVTRSEADEKTFLVSLRKAEFLSIIKCISISRDPVLCAKYGACEKELPPRVFAAHQKCQKEHVGLETLRCSKHEPLFKVPEIPAKLTAPEKKVMVKFEECAKKLQEESCKIVEGHHHLHRVRHHHL